MKTPRILLALATVMRTTRPIVVVGLFAAFAAAHVSAPQMAQGQDLQSLVGRWTGWISPTRGSNVPLVVDVKPDGTYTSRWGNEEGRGVLKMEGGKLVGEGQIAIGTRQVAQGTGRAELNYTVKDGVQTISGIGRDQEGPYNIHLTKTMAAAAPGATAQSGYALVTDQRLLKPEPENWLLIRGNYQGWNYSPLDQINASNVKKLIPVWSLSTGVTSGHQAPPIVNNGVMFVSTPYNQIMAMNAKTGDLIWRYRRELPEDFKPLHNTNRGIALYGDKVYLASLDCFLVALDAKTGKVVWEKPVESYKTGYYMTLAPLIAKGKVMVGVSGGEFGVRGFVQAFDAETGAPAWKTYTVPGPGQPGHESWSGDTWQRGGASVWITGTYDPDLNLTYWGTGNASPWFGDQRPGDNLYTSSTVAIEPDTGTLRNHFQYQWNESWDWDEPDAPMVIDYQKGGRSVKGLVHPARNGYLYMLERSKDKIGFVSATAYVKQNVFSSIDPTTGRPSYNPERIPKTGKRADFCPSLWGGKDWPNASYNPKTGRLFMPTNDNHCGFMEGKQQQYVAGKWWTGVDIPDIGFTVDKSAKYFGEIQAWDLNGGQRVWTHQFPASMAWGGVLSTGGNLVFAGGTNDRYFRAFDATSGQVLWQSRTNSGITSAPIAFSVDGQQYVAVVSGWGVDPEFQQGLLGNLLGWQKDVPTGGVIWVYALSQ